MENHPLTLTGTVERQDDGSTYVALSAPLTVGEKTYGALVLPASAQPFHVDDKGNVVVTLRKPIVLAGVVSSAITLRPATVGDMIDMDSEATGAAERVFVMASYLSNTPITELRAMSYSDGKRVNAAVAFLLDNSL